MPFTNLWDVSQPPDTQQANLLGKDIRDLKQDIVERMVGFASGLLADRPLPEAIFGNANDGVMYFATDTGHIFQWNGNAWNDITGNFVLKGPTFKAPNVVDHTGTVTLDPLYTLLIPAGSFLSNTQVRMYLGLEIINLVDVNNAPVLRINIGPAGGAQPAIIQPSLKGPNGAISKVHVFGGNDSVFNAQRWEATIFQDLTIAFNGNSHFPAPAGVGPNTTGVDTSHDVSVVVSIQNGNAADHQICERFFVELL